MNMNINADCNRVKFATSDQLRKAPGEKIDTIIWSFLSAKDAINLLDVKQKKINLLNIKKEKLIELINGEYKFNPIFLDFKGINLLNIKKEKLIELINRVPKFNPISLDFESKGTYDLVLDPSDNKIKCVSHTKKEPDGGVSTYTGNTNLSIDVYSENGRVSQCLGYSYFTVSLQECSRKPNVTVKHIGDSTTPVQFDPGTGYLTNCLEHSYKYENLIEKSYTGDNMQPVQADPNTRCVTRCLRYTEHYPGLYTLEFIGDYDTPVNILNEDIIESLICRLSSPCYQTTYHGAKDNPVKFDLKKRCINNKNGELSIIKLSVS